MPLQDPLSPQNREANDWLKSVFRDALVKSFASTPGGVGLGLLGKAAEYIGDVYERNIPADIRANLRDFANAPVPGSPAPLMKGITALDQTLDIAPQFGAAIPLIAKAAKAGSPKAANLLERLQHYYGFRLGEAAVPGVRQQQEAVNFPVSQGGRKGIFTSYGTDYQGYNKPFGAAEGGEHRVETLLDLTNPYRYMRDKNEHAGLGIIQQFDKEIYANEIKPNGKLANLIDNLQEEAFSWKQLRKEYPRITSLLTPKELKQAANSRQPQRVLKEALATKLMQKSGYTSVVQLRTGKSEADNKLYDKAYKLVEDTYKANGNDPHEFWKLNMIKEGAGDQANYKFLIDVESMYVELATKAKYRPQQYYPTQVIITDPTVIRKSNKALRELAQSNK